MSTTSGARKTNMAEIWRIIPGHEPYMASNYGRIVNAKTRKEIKPVRIGHKRRPYLGVYAGGGRNSTKIPLHRLVLKAFKGLPQSGKIGCHRNDDLNNNNLENLYWGTYKNNAQDSIKNGTFRPPAVKYGNNCQNTKHPEALIKKIREEYHMKPRKKRDGAMKALVEKYKIPWGTLSQIINNKSRRNG